MSSQINVSMAFQFADNSTKTFTIENVPAESIGRFKTNVKAINENADGQYAPFYEIFVAKDSGAHFAKITDAKITNIVEEVVYNG